MTFTTLGFPAILPDNDAAYFTMIQAVVASVDEFANLRVVRKPGAYSFTLTPSAAIYAQLLLQELLNYHRFLGLELVLSKSIRTTCTIQFDLPVAA